MIYEKYTIYRKNGKLGTKLHMKLIHVEIMQSNFTIDK